MTEAIASASSAGIPTSHGSQWRVIRSGREHVPGMHEDRGTQRLGGRQDGFEPWVVEVPVTDVGPDLDAGQAQLPDAPLQLRDGEVRVLERDGPEPGEPVRPRGRRPRRGGR